MYFCMYIFKCVNVQIRVWKGYIKLLRMVKRRRIGEEGGKDEFYIFIYFYFLWWEYVFEWRKVEKESKQVAEPCSWYCSSDG